MENPKLTMRFEGLGYCTEIKPNPLNEPAFFNSQHDCSVQPADDYNCARRKGIQYAAHLAQYLADNPDKVGSNILGVIAQGMTCDGGAANSASQGHATGFFTFLERLLYYAAEHIDVFTYAQQLHDDHQAGVRRGNPPCMCD